MDNADAHYLLSLLTAPVFESTALLLLTEHGGCERLSWLRVRPYTVIMDYDDVSDVEKQLTRCLEEGNAHSVLANIVNSCEFDESETELRGKLLFVDDSKTVRNSIKRLLSKNGYDVDVAESSNQALKMVQNERYDLAVIDYFMPNMLGDELCRRLRDDPETANITTSIYTSAHLNTIIKRSLDSGAVECMFKNESEDLFLARVDSMNRSSNIKKAVEKEHRYMEGILSSVGDGVYGVDKQGRISFMNPAAKAILGFEDKEYFGQEPHGLFHYANANGMLNPSSACFLSRAYESGDRLENWHTDFWDRG